MPSTAAGGALLNWRALHIAIRAVDAAITRERSEQRPTPLAVVVELTGVRWHQIPRLMTALGTGYRRVRFD
jgi:hypothetical protein